MLSQQQQQITSKSKILIISQMNINLLSNLREQKTGFQWNWNQTAAILHILGVIKKKPLFSNFVSYVCSTFAYIYFCYLGTHVCYICWQYQPFWIVTLFLPAKEVNRVYGVVFDFLLFEKIDQSNSIKFCI